ncbi:MAG TPA: OPT/YSL family transporter [Caulobacteraceae bacterium]|nr:OPT/YSL family transporter [Caulobacteraceae bacterium]
MVDQVLEHSAAPAKPEGAEFTVRALIAAIIVAVIMGASYPYMVLKLGFGPNVSVVSAFFGFLILNVIGRSTYNRWQNNIVQTAGTSAAQTAFMCGVLAAFDMLRESKIVHFTFSPTPLQTFVWLSCASLLGVLLAVPLRRHFVVDQNLPYPDGMAAGETLIVLDPPKNADKEDPGWAVARTAAKVLFIGLIASALVMLFSENGLIFNVFPGEWNPGALTLGVAGASFVVTTMGVGFGYSLLSLGTGLLVSFRVNLSMFVGGLIGWIAIPYWLVTHGMIADHPTKILVLYWLMWPAVAMIISSGLTSLLLRWRMLVSTFTSLHKVELSRDEFPLSWVIGGSIVLTIALCLMQYFALGIPVWMTLICILLAIVLMLVGLRALGETNWGPIGQLSNVMQGIFAVIAPGNPLINAMANATTGTVAVTSEGLMQDYRAGAMVGSTPRLMTYAQLIAAPIGAAALAVVYPLLVKTYGITGEHAQLSAPGSRRIAGFVEILTGGTGQIAPSALWAALIAAILGVVLAVLEDQKSIGNKVPSPMGLGLGLLLPFSAVSTIFVGSVGGLIWNRASPKTAAAYQVPLASGLIAGEALMAVILSGVVPGLTAAGVKLPLFH